jgi:AcrR family transcriptional regulator
MKGAISLENSAGSPRLRTMRRLASKMGVEAMSLYTYFDTKHALELAMCDHVLADVTAANEHENDPMRDAVEFAQAFRRALLAHPNTARLFATNMDLQGSAVVQSLTLQSLGILARVDPDAETVLYRYGTVLGFVVGHSLLEIAQQEADAPPKSTYDPDLAFTAGVIALLDGVAAPRRPTKAMRR